MYRITLRIGALPRREGRNRRLARGRGKAFKAWRAVLCCALLEEVAALR